MRRALGWLVLLMVATAGFGQVIGPRIQFDTTTIDVGELVQDCYPKFSFRLTNTGNEDLLISLVKGNDPMVPYWPREAIQPGQSEVVTIHYDTHRIGRMGIGAVVYTNDPVHPEVTIHLLGRIVAKPEQPARQASITQSTNPDIQVAAAQTGWQRAQILAGYDGIDLGNMALGTTREFFVKVRNTGTTDLIWGVLQDSEKRFLVLDQVRNIPPGGRDSVSILFTAEKVGNVSHYISYISNDQSATPTTHVYGSVLLTDIPSQRITGLNIHFTDTVVDLGAFVISAKSPGDQVYFICQNLGYEPLSASFTISPKYLARSIPIKEVKSLPPGKNDAVAIYLNRDSLRGKFDIPVIVTSNDREQPTRTLHIRGEGYRLQDYPPHGPRIEFETTTIDKGEMQQGSLVEYEYWFTNSGDEDLQILMVKSSCGCLVPSWSKEPIPPGGRGVIVGQYNSQRIGMCSKTLTVQTNDPTKGMIHLHAKCDIISTVDPLAWPRAPLKKPALIPTELPQTTTFKSLVSARLQENYLSIGNCSIPKTGNYITRTRIVNDGSQAISVPYIDCDPGIKVTNWTKGSINPGEFCEIEMSISPELGKFSRGLRIIVKNPNFMELFLTISGEFTK